MYNPQNLNECEKEKKYKKRKFADSAMVVIGVVASLSSIPQVLKIIETGTVAGLSFATQAIALTTVIAWFSYGIYIKNKPLIITTGISTIVLFIVIIQMLYYA
ncbi:MAG: hypothetical protein ISR99_01375 [Parcubacteria group bacterium]|nr:hypothetical protein [Parcubacteria group bacterium]